MEKINYSPNDFRNGNAVKWCAGCGDHAVFNSVLKALPEVAERLNLPREKFAFVSGIGCSSRFVYYMNTYGFHTIHGRAAAIATGLKTARPDLSVWVCSGDGDSLAIGGNHFIHACRRNINLNLILFNNEIYGLTKGQYSPTSKLGKVTKTSPFGTVEQPFSPAVLALGANASFVARTIDMEVEMTKNILVEAACHEGMSVTEALVNCVIFNHRTHADFAESKSVREERTIHLRHGEKMLFGANKEKGLVLDGLKLKVVTVGEDGYTMDDILTHDAHEENSVLHTMLASMRYPEFPVAVGIIRDVKRPTYDTEVAHQIEEQQVKGPAKSANSLFRSGEIWKIE
ncbi:MAG: 2-oxoacid:ferredoxin oxidoreductase subunit beta [Alistipes sp.]|nr:2-oxoacid:ferredoxin oxidoreductase subunit beta [Alistipes sp.]